MSVSKLESLPNEILIDIFEKYINGIDILNAFALQLNKRIDLLLAQCQRFRFDFMRCRKDDFRFSTGLLPTYLNRIEQLALSEEYTPGQIYAFLSFFPSFTLFKQLRKLYLHIDAEAIYPQMVENALGSLPKTNLNTLAIKITKPQTIPSLNAAIANIFHMKTLKRLSIDCYLGQIDWKSLNDAASNIEYLTLHGFYCQFDDLNNIFQCAPGLKYFNIQLIPGGYSRYYRSRVSPQATIKRMPMLHTAIFNIAEHDEKTPTKLEPYLKEMPSLDRLEIKFRDSVHGINIWETFFKTSLSKLTHFKLECSAIFSTDDYEKELEPIQNPLWIERPNFHVVVKKYAPLTSDQFDSDYQENSNRSESANAVYQWWIGPQRKINDHQSIANTITNFALSTQSISLLQGHYLGNVKSLLVSEFNDNLLELLITHVDCSEIKHLDISLLKGEGDKISSLLSYMENINSIRINLNLLIHLKEQCPKIRFIDLSYDGHRYDKKSFSTIGSLFPNVEHMTTSTRNLKNIPFLQNYVPHLRSLTIADFQSGNRNMFDDYEQKMADEQLRRSCQFLFQRRSNSITIWIDQAALNDPFWQNGTRYSQSPYDDDLWN